MVIISIIKLTIYIFDILLFYLNKFNHNHNLINLTIIISLMFILAKFILLMVSFVIIILTILFLVTIVSFVFILVIIDFSIIDFFIKYIFIS